MIQLSCNVTIFLPKFKKLRKLIKLIANIYKLSLESLMKYLEKEKTFKFKVFKFTSAASLSWLMVFSSPLAYFIPALSTTSSSLVFTVLGVLNCHNPDSDQIRSQVGFLFIHKLNKAIKLIQIVKCWYQQLLKKCVILLTKRLIDFRY